MLNLRPACSYRGLVVLLGTLVIGCAPAFGPSSPGLIGSHASAKSLVFAYEVTPGCQLESVPGEVSPVAGARWKPVRTNELAGTEVVVLERHTSNEDHRALYRALLVKEPGGRSLWLRNVPAESAHEVDRRWACAPDASRVASRTKPIAAEFVRIMPNAPSCAGLTPILGDTADVSFEPYAIAGRRLFHTSAGLTLGVTLVTGDGENALTVLGSDLDQCFAVTRRGPISLRDRTSIQVWLSDASGVPPALDIATFRQTVGLDAASCLSEGEGATRHDECRAAAFGTIREPGGPLGARFVFFRERIANAVHAYGGTLAPAEELAQVNVTVRQVQSKDDSSFSAAFSKSLLGSLLDASKQRTRNVNGYRLVRPQEAASGTTVHANLDVEVSFAMPTLETQQQDRRQRRVSGKVQAPNPEHARAVRRAEAAREALRRADDEAAAYDKLFARPQAHCGPQAPVACDVAARASIGAARAAKRREEVKALEATASAIPRLAPQDEVVAVDYHAKVYRRQGEATVTFRITPTDALPGLAVVQITRRVPFDATEVDVAAGPGVEAKPAKAPEREQVAQAVARAVLVETDALMATWMRRAAPVAPVAAFQPGSRAQLALLARYTASNRRVRLVSDFIEARSERLAARADYPIRIPAGAGGRCFTIVATALRVGADTNLALRDKTSRTLVARDARDAAEAGFDLCPIAPGDYVLEVTSSGATPVSVGMFESTPGIVPDPDYGTAMPASLERR